MIGLSTGKKFKMIPNHPDYVRIFKAIIFLAWLWV